MLRLTCGEEFGLCVVSRWIAGYLAAYPKMRVEADYTNRVVDIVKEGYDLAIRVGTLGDGDLTARRLEEAEYGLFAKPGLPGSRRAPRRPRDLDGHDTVVFGTPGRAVELRETSRNPDPRPSASPRASSSTSTITWRLATRSRPASASRLLPRPGGADARPGTPGRPAGLDEAAGAPSARRVFLEPISGAEGRAFVDYAEEKLRSGAGGHLNAAEGRLCGHPVSAKDIRSGGGASDPYMRI